MREKKEIKWINCAKFMAIFAVTINHTSTILYSNTDIAIGSYYSVSLFILISGMLCFWSNERHESGWFQTFIRSSQKIIIAYLLATFVYQIYLARFFDFKVYLQYVVSFNLSGPFYYVLLFLQLMLVNKAVYNLIRKGSGKYSYLWDIGMGAIILFVSAITTKYTNILDVYGGGENCLEEPICSCFI